MAGVAQPIRKIKMREGRRLITGNYIRMANEGKGMWSRMVGRNGLLTFFPILVTSPHKKAIQ